MRAILLASALLFPILSMAKIKSEISPRLEVKGLTAATDRRVYEQVDANTATVTITTGKEIEQASAFLDSKELPEFLRAARANSSSEIYKLALQIASENCDEVKSSPFEPIEPCGQVGMTEPQRTSFSRAGWAEAYATFTILAGFRHEGSGRFLAMPYLIDVHESVEAETKEDGGYIGKMIKTYSFGKSEKRKTQNGTP